MRWDNSHLIKYSFFLGSSSSPTLVRYQVGTGNSLTNNNFNIKTQLPKIYDKLSLINFALDATYTTLSASVSAVNKYIINNGSYNSSNGILRCSEAHGQAGSRPVVVQYIVYCYYIN